MQRLEHRRADVAASQGDEDEPVHAVRGGRLQERPVVPERVGNSNGLTLSRDDLVGDRGRLVHRPSWSRKNESRSLQAHVGLPREVGAALEADQLSAAHDQRQDSRA